MLEGKGQKSGTSKVFFIVKKTYPYLKAKRPCISIEQETYRRKNGCPKSDFDYNRNFRTLAQKRVLSFRSIGTSYAYLILENCTIPKFRKTTVYETSNSYRIQWRASQLGAVPINFYFNVLFFINSNLYLTYKLETLICLKIK